MRGGSGTGRRGGCGKSLSLQLKFSFQRTSTNVRIISWRSAEGPNGYALDKPRLRFQRKNDSSRRRETERFEQRLGEILEHATAVFYERGYEGASMRDLSRASGMSLAGLYYYFESKERLLYLIQKHTFDIVLRSARERLASTSDPEQRVRSFIHNHIEYFLKNRKAMTVMSHEDETLTGEFGKEIAELKREYYRCASAWWRSRVRFTQSSIHAE